MKKYLFIVLLVGVSFFSCSNAPKPIADEVKHSFIPISENSYKSINVDDVIIYYKRLNIRAKSEEIGIIIRTSTLYPNEEEILRLKELSAQYGANGLIVEGKNVVLLRIESKINDLKEAYNEI